MNTIIPVVSLMISILAFVGTLVIYAITRRRENYQNLLQRISVYFSPEMHTAVRQLWSLYRNYGDPAFLDKYIEIMVADNKKMHSIKVADRMEYQSSTLHYQRRIVSSFYRGLGILLRNGLVPSRATFETWGAEDIDLVGKVIIPIENRLCEFNNVKKMNPKTHALYYIANLRNRFQG